MSLFAVFFASFAFAQFHSSMTKVDYADGALKFTTKMNSADVAKTIKIDPNTTGFEAEVKKYVGSKVSVSVNGAPVQLTFTSGQVNGESVWVYYEARGVGNVSSLRIRNSILMESYPKQLNLVNINYKGSQKNMNFTRGNETAEVSF